MGAALAILLGLAIFSPAPSGAAAKPAGLTGSGVRHGMQYVECRHFQAVDSAALVQWGKDNSAALAAAVPGASLEGLIANPEPYMRAAMRTLFPECGDLYLTATFGPDNWTWHDAMNRARAYFDGYEGAAPGAPAPFAAALTKAFA